MSKISEALKQSQHWQPSPTFAQAVSYVLGQDDGALARLGPATRGSYGLYGLADALRSPDAWQEEDRRLVRAMAAMGAEESLGGWLDRLLKAEKADQEFHAIVCRELHGFTPLDVAAFTLGHLRNLAVDGRATSAGRFVLGLPERDMRKAMARALLCRGGLPLVELLFDHAPERLAAVIDDVLALKCHTDTYAILLKRGEGLYESKVLKAFEAEGDSWPRYLLAEVLCEHHQAKYRDLALAAARRSLAGPGGSNNHGPVAEWMIANFGKEIVPDLVGYLRKGQEAHWSTHVVQHAAKGLGADALPVLLAGVEHPDQSVRLVALGGLIGLGDAAQESLIQQHLDAGLSLSDGARALKYLALAGQWKAPLIEERLWSLLEHKSKPVRGAAVRALARLGDAALPRTAQLLAHKKSDVRLAAALMLTTMGTSRALELLESRVDAEGNDDVRDQILQGLEQVWDSQGRRITRQDVTARVERTAAKLRNPVAPWLKEDGLPPLRWTGGDTLSAPEVRYLLYRQSRAREMVADTEARAVYRLIDRSTGGDFAGAVLAAFLASGADAQDRWAMTVAGLLGDDRLVPVLVNRIKDWVEANRGKLAEYAVEALALLGTDAALMAVDSMAMRYRNKMKNVGRAAGEAFRAAAEALGVTVEELGDRVVPWLGFEAGKPRMIEAGDRPIRVTLGMDFKWSYLDVDRQKPVKTLPKTVPADVQKELKEQAVLLREVVKAQTGRLESLMVRQCRWPAERWRELFLAHPVLRPFGVRLAWAAYGPDRRLLFTFRALEDGTLTGAEDESVELPAAATVGIVHPLELDDAVRSRWQSHLADYDVTPPFPQLERPVILVGPEDVKRRTCTTVESKSLNAMTFKGRAERLGWVRGSVCDAGGIPCYGKPFPEAGADFVLYLDGLYIGIDMYSNITLRHGHFVKSGSVKTGSYVYDEPGDESDPRVLPFGEVPPIVFSEVMGDLGRIAGGAAPEE